MRFVCAAALAVLVIPIAAAQYRPGTGNPDEHRAPWKFLQGDALQHEHPVMLVWIPSSLEQVEPSKLMTADVMRVAATRCVDLEIVLPDRAALVRKLGAEGKVPTAMMVDRKGEVVRRAASGATEAIERMLSDELAARDEAMYREMREAGEQARAGNNAAAIDLYEKIWDDRCLFPLAGTEAQRSLKALGVTVVEPPPTIAVDPQLKPPTSQTPPSPSHSSSPADKSTKRPPHSSAE
jgi:hypothetical protein